jgi:hypothetical protein
LIFGLDATASRERTWDQACTLQAEIFAAATAAAKRVEVQLVYYRGHDECQASRWYTSSSDLNKTMTGVMCRAGETQIGRILAHARKEADRGGLRGLVFIGDAFEENIETMLDTATGLGMKGVPVFMLQEGTDRHVERAFKMIAHASNGVHLRFDSNAPSQMAKLLQAVGAYLATGDLTQVRALTGPGGPGRLGSR